MSFVAYWSMARVRVTWRALVPLVLLVGLASGSIVALVTGGLRTDSAYPRFHTSHRGADATVFENQAPAQALADMRVLMRLPAVSSSGIFQGYQTLDGTTVGGPLGSGYEHTVSVPRLVEGRLPLGAGEAAVDWTIAQAHHLQVGDVYRVSVVSDAPSPSGKTLSVPLALHVVGIAVNPDSFPPFSEGQSASVLVDRSFMDRHRGDLGVPLFGLELRLHGGQRGLAGFEREAQHAFPNQPQVVTSTATQTQAVENSIHPAAVALWLLAAALAMIGVLIVYQLFRRLSAAEQDGYITAVAHGAARRQLLAAELFRAGVVAGGASVVAGIVAVALSPLFPLGTARVAEPDPGLWVDAPVLAAGTGAVVVLTLALAAWPAWRTTAEAAEPASVRAGRTPLGPTASWAPRWLWLRPVAWVGLVLGLRTGRGATAVPVRASIVAMCVAAAGLSGALTFGASLEHLYSTPALYGWSWGAHIYDNGQAGTPVLVPRLVSDHWISGVTVADTGIPLRINGKSVPGADLDARKGRISVVTPEGRAPVRAEDITLGQNTLQQLDVHVGSQVRVTISAIAGPTRTFTVVGTTIAPWIDQTETFTGGGAIVTHAGLQRLIPARTFDIPTPSDAFVDFAPGTTSAARVADLQRQIGEEYAVAAAQPPTDLLNFGRVQNLPLVLGLLLVGLAAVTLFLTLIAGANRRRVEMAVLKALGYRPTQLQGLVACQSTGMTLVGVGVGVPLGIALGRWLWIAVADHLGLLADPVVPAWQIALVALAALVLAIVAGAWPGLLAARTPVAKVLRAA